MDFEGGIFFLGGEFFWRIYMRWNNYIVRYVKGYLLIRIDFLYFYIYYNEIIFFCGGKILEKLKWEF